MWSDKFVQYLTWKISGMHFCLEQKTIDTFAWYHPLNFSHGCVVWHWYTPAAPLTNAPATKWRISVKWQELNRPGTFIVPPFSFITIKCKHESLFYHLRSIFFFFCFFFRSLWGCAPRIAAEYIIPCRISTNLTHKRCLLLRKASFICLMRLLSVNISCLLVYSGTSLAVHCSHLEMFSTQYFTDKQWCCLLARQCQHVWCHWYPL